MLPDSLFAQENSKGLLELPAAVPWNQVEFLYLDPPWHFRVRSKKGLSRSAENHYPTLGMKDIAALPVYDLLAKNAWAWCWTTEPLLEETYEIVKKWGLKVKTFALTWVKTTKTGKWHVGTGYYTRANPEMCLFITKGKGLRRQSKAVRELLIAPLGKHSAKPYEAYSRIMRITEGEGWLEKNSYQWDHLYLELFARNYFAGWLSAGLDLPAPGMGQDIRNVLSRG